MCKRAFGILAPVLTLALALAVAAPCRALAQQQGISVVFDPRAEAVISARVPSVILKIGREFGQRFSAGQVLVQLDPVIYKIKAAKTAAELEAAKSAFEITLELFEGERSSRLELEEARRDFLVAKAEHDMAEQLLSHCVVRAPFSGRVRAVAAHAGEMVEEGKPLMAIVDDSRMLAKYLLPSHLYKGISLGRKVRFRVNETNGLVEGEISHISSVIDPASHTIEVYATVNNKNGELRPGMTAIIEGGM
jgi:RND family efflux transporter MFP subunit